MKTPSTDLTVVFQEKLRSLLFTLFAIIALVMGTASAQAALIGFTLENIPDILIGNIAVDYNASTDLLSASGAAISIDDDGVGAAESIADGLLGFALSVPVDNSGSLAAATGTLVISGTVASLGYTSGTLLTANVTDFGFDDTVSSSVIMDLRLDITGGDAQPLWPSADGGIILTGITGFGGWNANWDNLISGFSGTGLAVADVGALVPEPSSIVLLFSLAALVCVSRRF